MIRRLLFGALGFAAAVVLERQFGNVFSDMRRYDRMRKMSGDRPLYQDGFRFLTSLFGNSRPRSGDGTGLAPHGAPDDKSLLDSVREDIRRYAAIRAM